jgi:hypothetical protein
MTSPGPARLYLKEADLKTIPAGFSHALLPLLFAEAGSIPDAKGKKKKCFITVNAAAIGLFRLESGHQVKSAESASVYDITEIVWVDNKRRGITTKQGTFYFICDHADEAIGWIIGARNVLLAKVPNATPIRLQKFQMEPKSQPPETIPNWQAISQLRYVALCSRYQWFRARISSNSSKISARIAMNSTLTILTTHLSILNALLRRCSPSTASASSTAGGSPDGSSCVSFTTW